MSTQKRKFELYSRLQALGFTYEEACQLRRIEMTLQRWAERECGDGSNWAIERDEATGKPYNTYHGEGKPRRYPVADREAGALRRLKAITLARNSRGNAGNWVYYYHQSDPRGCALYLLTREQLKASDNQIIAKAKSLGAEIKRACETWKVSSNGKHYGYFASEERAAISYLMQIKAIVPDAWTLPLDQYYTRGVAVCA